MLGDLSDELRERFGHRGFLRSVAAPGLFGPLLYPLASSGLGSVGVTVHSGGRGSAVYDAAHLVAS